MPTLRPTLMFMALLSASACSEADFADYTTGYEERRGPLEPVQGTDMALPPGQYAARYELVDVNSAGMTDLERQVAHDFFSDTGGTEFSFCAAGDAEERKVFGLAKKMLPGDCTIATEQRTEESDVKANATCQTSEGVVQHAIRLYGTFDSPKARIIEKRPDGTGSVVSLTWDMDLDRTGSCKG